MNVFTFSEARQKLANLLERASKDGEVQIKRRDGQRFVVKPLRATKSPLDVRGINLKICNYSGKIIHCKNYFT